MSAHPGAPVAVPVVAGLDPVGVGRHAPTSGESACGFQLAALVFLRLHQLEGGSRPRVEPADHKLTRLALLEVLAGVVSWGLASEWGGRERLVANLEKEIGRWECEKCARTIVAVGTPAPSFPGVGAYIGPCPWECGAYISRGFRHVKPGKVRACRSDEWGERAH